MAMTDLRLSQYLSSLTAAVCVTEGTVSRFWTKRYERKLTFQFLLPSRSLPGGWCGGLTRGRPTRCPAVPAGHRSWSPGRSCHWSPPMPARPPPWSLSVCNKKWENIYFSRPRSDLVLVLTVLPVLLLCQDVLNIDVLLVYQHGDDAPNVVAVRHFSHDGLLFLAWQSFV